MSLQVWLPLTKDLRQQGLSNISVTNNGAAYDTNGKLGGCYYFDGIDDRIACSELSLPYPLSICAWFKPTDITNSNTQYWLSYNTASGGTAGHAIAIGTYQGKLAVWRGAAVYNSFSQTLSNNQWYHITVTISENKNCYVYLDGVQIYTATCGNNPGSSWLTLGARSNSATGGAGAALYYYKGYMNDARFYDHCLSAEEVKRISQGLVLHYPLNRQGWGQFNFLTNSTGYQGVTDWSGVVSTGVENGQPYLIAKRTDTTSSSRTFCTHSAITNLVSSWSPGDSFTISGYYKIPSTETYAVGGNMFIRWTYTTSASTYADTGFTTPTTGITKDKWIRFENTYTVPANYQNGSVNFYLSAFSNGLSTIYWKNIKLEYGNKATPWCPNSGDSLYTTLGLNGNIEYDMSGFCNNGTRTGTFSWSSNAPKYSVSTYFEDYTRYISCSLGGYTPDAITMSCWVKTSNTSPRGGFHIPFNVHSTDFEISITGSTGKARMGYVVGGTRKVKDIGVSIQDGQWHMLTSTYDGSAIKRYVDGVLIDTESATGALSTLSTVGVGAFPGATTYGNTQVYQSDCRIYMTALSASDILSLYQNCATIDSNGTIHGAIH